MDHRTTSQEAAPNGHQKVERDAPPDAIAALATLQAAHLEELKAAYARIAKLEADLAEAGLQIEYLHGKFQPTGTSEAVLARINETLNGSGAF